MSNQQKMEEHIRYNLNEIYEQQIGLVNEMLKPEYGDCSYREGLLSLEFQVQPWAVNKVGTIHGGILATILDMTAGVMARFYAGENFAPTAELDIKYLRPAEIGDTLVATARKLGAGRRIISQTIEITNKATGKVVASGSTMHLNADTSKERK